MRTELKVAATIALLSATSAMAQDHEGRIGFAVGADLEYGGDDVATVSFEDGDSQDVKAGQGVTVAAGMHYTSRGDMGFVARGTIGYKFVTTAADNADIGMDRMVYELVGGYQFDNGMWLAAGPVRHANVEFDADGFGPNIEFADANGLTFEIGWRWVSLAYTKIEYEPERYGSLNVAGSPKMDASNFGLALSYRF